MENKFSISLVSYWNTRPFLFGMEYTGLHADMNVLLDIPAAGGQRIINGQVDIALAPVITLNSMPDARVITNYCIGASEAVHTVCLFSTVPIYDVKKIYLDNHSMTSVQLLRILLKEYWNLEVAFETTSVAYGSLNQGDAALVIGDKAFDWHGKFLYTYDLAETWISHTGLPFVFAAWITRKDIPEHLIQRMNEAFKTGLEHMEEVAESIANNVLSKEDLLRYYTRHISYELNDQKRMGMELFLKKAAGLPALKC